MNWIFIIPVQWLFQFFFLSLNKVVLFFRNVSVNWKLRQIDKNIAKFTHSYRPKMKTNKYEKRIIIMNKNSRFHNIFFYCAMIPECQVNRILEKKSSKFVFTVMFKLCCSYFFFLIHCYPWLLYSTSTSV